MYDELICSLRCCADNPCYDCKYRGEYMDSCDGTLKTEAADAIEELSKPRWIPVTERLPSDFVSVQAHMTDAGNFPPVREAYVVNKNWFFPALKEFHPVDMWRRFDEPPEEE